MLNSVGRESLGRYKNYLEMKITLLKDYLVKDDIEIIKIQLKRATSQLKEVNRILGD